MQLQKLQLGNLQALSSLVHAKELEDVVVAQLKRSKSNSLLPQVISTKLQKYSVTFFAT